MCRLPLIPKLAIIEDGPQKEMSVEEASKVQQGIIKLMNSVPDEDTIRIDFKI